jgi:hypothetical protein
MRLSRMPRCTHDLVPDSHPLRVASPSFRRASTTARAATVSARCKPFARVDACGSARRQVKWDRMQAMIVSDLEMRRRRTMTRVVLMVRRRVMTGHMRVDRGDAVVGVAGHFDIDAQTLAVDWDVDLIKMVS